MNKTGCLNRAACFFMLRPSIQIRKQASKRQNKNSINDFPDWQRKSKKILNFCDFFITLAKRYQEFKLLFYSILSIQNVTKPKIQ